MKRTLVLFSLLVAVPVLGAAPAPKTDVERAKDAFNWAQRLYKQARYTEAVAKFEEAWLLKPHPVVRYNIGRCHEQLGDLPQAMRAYRDYLRLAPDAKDREIVSDALANLERRLQDKGVQQVLVYAEPSSAVISVDGRVLGTSPASVELSPGNHQVVVTAPGHESQQRAFVLTAQRSVELSFSLKAAADVPVAVVTPAMVPIELPPPTPPLVTTVSAPPARKPRIATWVAGGAALAGAGVAAGMFAGSVGTVGELRAMERPRAEQDVLATRAQDLQTGGVVAASLAGAALVTAVVLFFVEGQ